MIEVSGFALMAVFISRLGITAVAGHQIAANLVSVLFMMPMALASATSTLVAQRVGAQDSADARRLTRHGIVFGLLVAGAVGTGVFLGRAGVGRRALTSSKCAPLMALARFSALSFKMRGKSAWWNVERRRAVVRDFKVRKTWSAIGRRRGGGRGIFSTPTRPFLRAPEGGVCW